MNSGKQNEIKQSVLVVDDDDDFRQIVKEIMEDMKLHVVEARNGYEGLEIAKKNEVCAIVSDINMPMMDGLRFLSELRASNMETPFIILTGYGDKNTAITALRYGAFGFLEKPFEPLDLENCVREAVDYGVRLKQLDIELEEAYQKAILAPEKIEEFRKAKRAVLFLKKQRRSA